MKKKAIIVGAGPAGLTAAYELLKKTDIVPIILEKSGDIGGISKTIDYKGNRMDMGPHRFFSKSDRVMQWWLNIMPLQNDARQKVTINYQNKSRDIRQEDTETSSKDAEKVMLVIQRLTRIYFLRKFFAYPIQLSLDTLRTLGLIRTIKILFSFLWVRFFPRKPEKSLEDFIINKFGKQLYLLFFKDYTEKVWGVPCHEISAEWGAQRIKGVSLGKAISQALKTMRKTKRKGDIHQKETETSLIEQFLYPKKGPGALWEEVARQVQEMGGKIYLNQEVTKIRHKNKSIAMIETVNLQTGQTGAWEGDYFFSSMPVQELIADMEEPAPQNVQEVAGGLQYRDFINVGILLKQLSSPSGRNGVYEKLSLKDNWIYIQERDVKVGRLMIYNNWGEGMIRDPNTTWIGMEYFCNKTDSLWARSDEDIQKLAISELEKMELARTEDVLDATVRRMEKTYPAYFGTYDRFDEIKQYINQFGNLFLVGRNGMHKYNNADHSMLTAMVAVDNIISDVTSKENLWAINTEQEYHEEKKTAEKQTAQPVAEQSQLVPKAAMVAIDMSFSKFVFGTERNRRFLGIGIVAILVQFIVFKVLYPFPDFFSDSYSYIDAAANNANVGVWPIGYSKFLAAFHAITHSHLALTCFQYLFLELSAFSLFFTVEYFYKLTGNNSVILFLFLFFNPLFLYISNYVSSDALFTSVSLLWVVQLLWIIKKPSTKQVYIQALLLFTAFTIRYNAMYYPVIAALAFLLSKHKIWAKLAGVAVGVTVVLLFVGYTSNKTKALTGTKQFSVFSGWQLANNALYLYPHIQNLDETIFENEKVKDFNSRVKRFFDTTDRSIEEVSPTDGAFYMRYYKGPLKTYYRDYSRQMGLSGEVKTWGSVSPIFSEFGSTIIKSHPAEFMKFYVLPNIKNYFLPSLEKLEMYNLGANKIYPSAKTWFDLKDQKVKSISLTAQGSILFLFPTLFMFVNIVFISSLMIIFFRRKGVKLEKKQWHYILLSGTILTLNFLFSVLASPIVLRYQLAPIIVGLSFSLVMVELLEIEYLFRKKQETNYIPHLTK
jgi:protoporphyrinogen oxidase